MRCTNNSRIQEKLLSKNPTLKEALSIARSVEHTAKCIQEMKTPKELGGSVLNIRCPQEVDGEVFKIKNKEIKSDKPISDVLVDKAGSETTNLKCFRCGSSNHLANNPRCPAHGVTCNKCNRKGHFARVCRSRENEQVKLVRVGEDISPK